LQRFVFLFGNKSDRAHAASFSGSGFPDRSL
jgi:hypothetical protein